MGHICITALKRDGWLPTSNSRVCSIHFITGRPSDDPLHPDYAPSRLPHRPVKAKGMERYNRSKGRISVAIQPEEEEVEMTEVIHSECNNDQDPKHQNILIGTDLSMGDIEDLQKENAAIIKHIKSLEAKLQELQDQTSKSTVYDLHDDKKIKFFTGLPSAAVFFTLLTYLTTAWTPKTSTLSPENQFFPVLMKLRLGLTHRHLAYQFKCSYGTVSAIFHDWLEIMSHRLQYTLAISRRPTQEYTTAVPEPTLQ
ncbi:hypothetical protein SKAU_G00244800 [Synaphobranchus kaupii]|uniref:Transposase Helix-turn-helix domain-containing protein n=1 Tax=Synaphobranchus kaupii TaxID=118154 RepID=A0A9Q1F1L1_SYNKA|nr:hypothetical protein SKAU_G00244800 [Synaphobranchus kaupii]